MIGITEKLLCYTISCFEVLTLRFYTEGINKNYWNNHLLVADVVAQRYNVNNTSAK